VTFNIPKFMEAKLVYRAVQPVNPIVPNSTTPEPNLNLTVEALPDVSTAQKWIPMVSAIFVLSARF
jgi:hypothetical protein